MDVRVRMVLLGLVLGVVVAVIVAAQGCGDSGHKRKFHGSAPGGGVALAAWNVGPFPFAHPGPAATLAQHRIARRGNQEGAFFGFRRGRIARVDAPRVVGRAVALTFDDGPGPQTAQIVRGFRRRLRLVTVAELDAGRA